MTKARLRAAAAVVASLTARCTSGSDSRLSCSGKHYSDKVGIAAVKEIVAGKLHEGRSACGTMSPNPDGRLLFGDRARDLKDRIGSKAVVCWIHSPDVWNRGFIVRRDDGCTRVKSVVAQRVVGRPE